MGSRGPGRSPSSPARAVVFDLYITLTDFDAEQMRPAFAAALADALGVDPDAFAGALRASFEQRATGSMGDVRATLAALVNQLGITPDPNRIEQALELRRDQELQITQPRPGVLETIREIRALGWRTGLVSDCTPELADLWPHLPYGDVLDATVFSYELGYRKPAAILYETIAARLDVDPSSCVYLGDGSSEELTGAQAAGMTAVLLDTPFDGRFRYDAEPNWSGHSISAIEDLVQLLSSNTAS